MSRLGFRDEVGRRDMSWVLKIWDKYETSIEYQRERNINKGSSTDESWNKN